MKPIVSVLALSVCAPAYALDCQGIQSMSDYFTAVQQNNLQKTNPLYAKLLRKSVASFHGDLSAAISDQAADEMGEGVVLSLVKDPSGKTFQAVNVGFGNGNAATYYYHLGSLNFLPVMSYDGECVEQGQTREFPIEALPPTAKPHTVNCTLSSGNAPFQKLAFNVDLATDGSYYGSPVHFKVSDEQSLAEGLSFALPRSQTDSNPIPYRSQEHGLQWSGELAGSKDAAPWSADLALSVAGSQLTVRGKAFPHIAGGYWSDQAKEYQGSGACEPGLAIKSIRYQRIIKF